MTVNQDSSRYSTILFDFDGTLTNSLDLWVQAFQHAFAFFKLTPTEDAIIADCFYRSLDEVCKDYDLPVDEFKTQFQLGIWTAFENPALFPGVMELLQRIHGLGIKLGLVTSSSSVVVHKSLQHMGVDSFFGTIVTANDVINFKPHPEPVLKALTQLGSEAAQTIFVGDSTADILAGHAAGTDTALFFPSVHHRFYEFEALNASRPHFVFGDYAELVEHLFQAKQA